MASPSTTICPDVIGSRPKRARTNSDLPVPMSPPIPTISPPRPRLRQPRHAACCERVVGFDIWHRLHHRLHFFAKIVVRTRTTLVSERRSGHPIRSVLTRSRREARRKACAENPSSGVVGGRCRRTTPPGRDVPDKDDGGGIDRSCASFQANSPLTIASSAAVPAAIAAPAFHRLCL
jgi:hypothetical protein